MKIAKGDTVYLADGTKCEYGHELYHNKHVVYILSRLHEDPESDLYSHPIIVEEFYSDPPIAERHKEVTRLDTIISDKQTRLIRIQEDLRKAELQRSELSRMIGRHQALQHVIDFLEGTIRYAVVNHGGEYDIKSIPELLETNDRFASVKGIRLLSLFGNIKGELQWGVNSYSDGSGITTTVWPFHHIETARTFLIEHIEKEVDKALKHLNIHMLSAYEKSYDRINNKYALDLKLPKAASAAIRQQRIINHKTEIQQLEDRLSGLKEQLSALEQKAE